MTTKKVELTADERTYLVELLQASLDGARDGLETETNVRALQKEIKSIRQLMAKLVS